MGETVTVSREILQQALEALENSRVFVTTREKIKHPEGTEWYDERITALRKALAQQTQTPCDIAEDGVCEVIDCCRIKEKNNA
jgi:formiminotetrahydrofolate cyclodeaminase